MPYFDTNTFNPDIQYKCDFIRGKSISRMEDFLPIYTGILNDICPISVELFDKTFDSRMAQVLHIDSRNESQMKKVRNHRTENVTKILGLVYKLNDIVYLSERTKKYLRDNDQPALFKSVCFQFQQPNGSQTLDNLVDKLEHQVSIRPFHFVITLLKIAYENDIRLTKMELYYYVLNCLQTLQGLVSPQTVFAKILSDRAEGIEKHVTLDRNYAWTFQHLNEQLDYLKLANLLREDRYSVWINIREISVINFFVEELNRPLRFQSNLYDFDRPGIFKEVEQDWLLYMGLSEGIDLNVFNTGANAFDVAVPEDQPADGAVNTVELGDRGETFVMEYERSVVRQFNQRLLNRIHYLGHTHGLGYDIQSIEANRAECQEEREMTRYIEVKTTTRVSAPNPEYQDTINLTRNEWVAACQQREHFYIYRLYFTNSGTYLHILKNPYQKNEDGAIYATPTQYRIEYNSSAVDDRIEFHDNERVQ